MQSMNVSFNVFKTIYETTKVFYVEQVCWYENESVDFIRFYAAKQIGVEVVLNTCFIKTNDLDGFVLTLSNKCDTEEDAISLALNLV